MHPACYSLAGVAQLKSPTSALNKSQTLRVPKSVGEYSTSLFRGLFALLDVLNVFATLMALLEQELRSAQLPLLRNWTTAATVLAFHMHAGSRTAPITDLLLKNHLARRLMRCCPDV